MTHSCARTMPLATRYFNLSLHALGMQPASMLPVSLRLPIPTVQNYRPSRTQLHDRLGRCARHMSWTTCPLGRRATAHGLTLSR